MKRSIIISYLYGSEPAVWFAKNGIKNGNRKKQLAWLWANII